MEASTNARLDAMEASTNARLDAMDASTNARLDAMEASTNARLEAMEASTNARLDAIQATTSARFDAVDTQLDIMGWGVMLTLGIVAAMGGKGFFRRTERRERSEDSAAVSASRHTES